MNENKSNGYFFFAVLISIAFGSSMNQFLTEATRVTPNTLVVTIVLGFAVVVILLDAIFTAIRAAQPEEKK